MRLPKLLRRLPRIRRWSNNRYSRRNRPRISRKHTDSPLPPLQPLEDRLLLAANVVINEIMYHPDTHDPIHEYIELANFGDEPANLNNWEFTRGIDFTFPPVTLNPGQFLVVAANENAFINKYGNVPNLVGGWTGKLANDSERIKLENELGDQIDEVTYADEGDWADRRLIGNDWSWVSPHDGGGNSLELINHNLSNKRGANWNSSNTNGGTPGAPNSVRDSNIAPLIRNVEHFPAVPTSSDTVTITAEFEDETPANISASVFYRVADGSPGNFIEVQMLDDGLNGDGAANDGVYGATLPARSNSTIIEYYVQASDGSNERSWPKPSNDAGTEHRANAHYQVDNEVPDPNVPMYRLIMTENEWVRFEGRPNSSNDQAHITFISYIDGEYKVRHNTSMRVRGNGSRSDFPTNWRINFPSDDTWEGVQAINLNQDHSYNQLLGMQIFDRSGLPSEGGRRVMVRVNSDDQTRHDRIQFGSYVHLEVPSSEWAEDYFPADSNGNFYRGQSGDLRYRGNDPGNYRGNYEKKTNEEEDDWSDLIAVTRALDDGETPDNVFMSTLESVADVQQWLRFFAVNALLVNEENGLINGRGDDFSMYAGAEDTRMRFVVHDLDTIFNQGDIRGSADRDLFETEAHPRLDRVLQNPTYRSFYFAHLKQLAETVFSAEQLNPLMDELIGGWVPNSVLNDMKSFAAQRVAYVLSQIPPGTPELDPVSDDLRVTEIMYNPPNPTAAELAVNPDWDSDDFEFIELRNIGENAIDLEGISIAQAIDFTFPDMDLNPGERVVVVKNLDAFTLRYGDLDNVVGPFTSSLSNGGEEIILTSPLIGPFHAFEYDDEGSWPERPDGNGASLVVASTDGDYNDSGNWNSSPEYAGSPSRGDLPDRSDVVITEILTHTDLPFVDSIELFNGSRDPVDISHWFISDSSNDLFKYQFPTGTTIPSFGYLVIDESDFNAGGPNNPTPFALDSAEGDDLWLLEGDTDGPGRFVDRIKFGASENGVTFGRYTNSAGYVDITATSSPTLGSTNTDPFVADVVINEIMYNPPLGHTEFVEIINRGSSTVNLFDPSIPANTWAFTNGIDFTFPQGVSLAPDELVLVVPIDPADYRAARNIPANIQIFGPYSGSLDNGGEMLELGRPDTPELDGFIPMIPVDRVRFNDKAPWPANADGLGPSLSRANLDAWSNEPANWDAGVNGGTPGRTNVFTDSTPPTAPEDVTSTFQDGNLLLNWSPSIDNETGVSAYRIYRNDQFLGESATPSYTDVTFTPAASTIYEITAVNGTGFEGDRSDPHEVIVNQISFQSGVQPDNAYDGTDDAWLVSANPDSNNGSAQFIEVDGSDDDTGGGVQMSLIRWDLSQIPAGSSVLSASITFNYDNNSSNNDYWLYQVRRDWNESQVTWNNASNGNPWEQPGLNGTSDRSDEILANIISDTFGFVSHDLNADGLEVLEQYINNPAINFGFAITNPNSFNGFAAHSSESGTVTNRPRLEIAYIPFSGDSTPPTAAIQPVSPDPRNSSIDTININFSEPVTGFTIDDISLTRDGGPNILPAGASITNIDPATYQVTGLASVTSTAGNYQITLNASGSSIQDQSANLLATDASDVWVVDTAAPTVNITPVSPASRNTPVTSVTITFSEPVQDFTLADLNLTRDGETVSLGGAASLASFDQQTWSLEGLSGLTNVDGDFSLTIAPGSVTDTASNPLASGDAIAWSLDSTGPIGTFQDVSPDPRNQPVSSINITFNEPVNGFNIDDLSLRRDGGANLLSATQSVTSSDGGTTWTINGLNSITNADGQYVLILQQSSVGDLIGNLNTTPATESFTIDRTGPIPNILNVSPDPRNSSLNSITIEFNEAISNLDIADFSLTRDGGVNLLSGAQSITSLGDNRYALTGLSSVTQLQGDYRLRVIPGPGVVDTLGNQMTNDDVETWATDTTAPIATITPVSPDPRNTSVSNIRIAFPEIVSGFDISDVSLTRDGGPNLIGPGQSLSSIDGRNWTIQNLSAITSAHGNYQLLIDADSAGITDTANNPMTLDILDSWTMDSVQPTVNILEVTPDPRDAAVSSITFQFSEPVLDFELSDLTLVRNNGSDLLTGAQSLTTTDEITWTLSGLSGLTTVSGRYDLTLSGSEGDIMDIAGNPFTDEVTESWTTISANALVANIADVSPNPRSAAVSDIRIIFNRPAFGVDIGDFELSRDNGPNLITGPVTVNTTDNLTFTFTGLADLTLLAGDYEFRLLADNSLIEDAEGEPLTADATSNWTTDTTPPTIAIDSVTPSTRNDPLSQMTLSFSEPVSGLQLNDFTLSRAQSTIPFGPGVTLTSTDNGKAWTIAGLQVVTSIDGSYTLNLNHNSSGVTDIAGNALANSDSVSWSIDTTSPTADIVDVSPDPRGGSIGAISINFSEVVTGVTLDDLRLTRNGGANLLGAGQAISNNDGNTWLLTGLSSITSTPGTYTLTLIASGSNITDSVGNLLTQNASDTWSVDASPPTASIIPVSPDPRSTSVQDITINFSKPVTGFDISDLTLQLNGGSTNLLDAQTTLTTTDNETFTLGGLSTITSPSGIYSLTLNAFGSDIRDTFGNPMLSSPSETWRVTTPSVVSVAGRSSNGTYTIGQEVDIDVIFSQPIIVDTSNGRPTLVLETGSADREAIFVSSSGAVATFRYLVEPGDASSDLNYNSTSALLLNSGTIRNVAGSDFNLTLPATSSPSSLASASAIVIDAAPTGAAASKFFGGGLSNGLAIDQNNVMHFVYFDAEDGFLKYAPRAANGVWGASRLIDNSSAEVGLYVDVELDNNGLPAAAYYDAANGDLKFARFNGLNWTVQTVQSKRTVGLYPSLAFDQNNNPAIAYYHKSNGNLLFAQNTAGAWDISVIESVDDVGRYPSLKINPNNGQWSVAYENTTDGRFRFAEQIPDSTWTTQTIDATLGGGGFISLDYLPDGSAGVSYYDAHNADLKFATRSAGTWTPQVVAAKRSQGLYTSLLVDQAGQVNIFYFNKTSDSLVRALRNPISGEWTFNQLAVGGGRWARVTQADSGAFNYSWWNSQTGGVWVEVI